MFSETALSEKLCFNTSFIATFNGESDLQCKRKPADNVIKNQ